jgi:diadenosine tetraphosphatase ApaH/serine/threonine PP2A family protein phosphatase
MCDLLWSDPDDRGGWGISPRGAGYTFGQVRGASSSSSSNTQCSDMSRYALAARVVLMLRCNAVADSSAVTS